MNLNKLTPLSGSVKKRKRLGRGNGSGLGKSAGRGDKGAGQRSGYKKRPWFEGGQMSLARRLPMRGFRNNFKKHYQIVNLDLIAETGLKYVDVSILYEKGLIKTYLKPVKILGNGELKSKVDITASVFSETAKKKIEKAGGTAKVQ